MDRVRPDADDRPLPGRVRGTPQLIAEVLARHRAAVVAGDPVYLDPRTGLTVFTSRFLAERGWCCDSGCRHCPFEVRSGR